jgi:DNA-binding NarL/FixJ family response regulator
MINIAVLEDNLVLQERLVTLLKSWDYAGAVYAAGSNKEFSELLGRHEIDLLLADLSLPDGSGINSIKNFLDSNPEGTSIVVSSRSDSDSIIAAIRGGAIGYLHKDDTSIGIIGAIKLALSGESPISPAIAFKILDSIKVSGSEDAVQAEKFKPNTEILTNRELEVLTLISKGYSYNEASAMLGISNKTLPVHVRKIYLKLQSKNRSEAVFKARGLGILE